MSAASMAVAAWVTAACAVVGTVVNSLGWNRHARKDDRRFREVNGRAGKADDSEGGAPE